MKHLQLFEDFVNEKKWSGEVETHFKPEEGIFTKGSVEIAKYLKSNSKDLKQAMSRLNFYINRAGKHLKGEDKARLEKAKDELHKLYSPEEK